MYKRQIEDDEENLDDEDGDEEEPAAAQSRKDARKEALETVSYTHLTLPTSDLV